MKNSGILLSVMAGLATGVILGILFAPDKGSQTRENISRKGEELSEEIKHKIHQFGEFISEKLDSTSGVYKHFIKTGKSAT